MPYDSTSTPIRERILRDIEAALNTVQGPPAYHHKLAVVQRFGGNEFRVPNYPAAIIVPGPTKSNDQRLALIEHTLSVTVLLMVRSQSWKTELETLCADCRVALLSDWTRGGVALTTRGAVEDIIDSEPSSPLGGAQMELEVLYRTLYHDPGSST